MAVPFVQGQLRGEALSVEIESECGHCGHALRLTVGSDLTYSAAEGEPTPLIFEPSMDWSGFSGANIIDAY